MELICILVKFLYENRTFWRWSVSAQFLRGPSLKKTYKFWDNTVPFPLTSFLAVIFIPVPNFYLNSFIHVIRERLGYMNREENLF